MSRSRPRSTREALEEAIRADPEDLATHSAYADLLMEEGDPRGEFMQVQLALEDRSLPRKDRDRLKRSERKLLNKHEREWLGPLAPILLDQTAQPDWRKNNPESENHHQWHRGVLSALHLGCCNLTVGRALRDSASLLPCLRELRISWVPADESGTYEEGPDLPQYRHTYDTLAFYPLEQWPVWQQIRIFQLGSIEEEDYGEHSAFGSRVDGENLDDLLRQLPDVEELYLFARNLDPMFALPRPHLRVLQYYHGNYWTLGALGKNTSLASLTHLLIHPHEPYEMPTIEFADFNALVRSPHLPHLLHLRLRMHNLGDHACEALVESGILKRLKSLDLRHGTITDEGARILAGCPDLANLEQLDLSRNCLSEEGIALLERPGMQFEAGWQGTLQHNDAGSYHEHLYEGDQE
jgi:uncharacterized protein (TIGR02996 family)